jgi:hypothetical protein
MVDKLSDSLKDKDAVYFKEFLQVRSFPYHALDAALAPTTPLPCERVLRALGASDAIGLLLGRTGT